MALQATGRQHWHLVGIGGSGMGALAEILLGQGHRVTGSDASVNATVKRLVAAGATITRGHHGVDLVGAHRVVYSAAIAPDNPELLLAKKHGIPMVARGQMLADIMSQKKGIAVAGTHGKTTTTSLLATLLLMAAQDPAFAIGGVLHRTQCNGRWGEGDCMVAEADESDASFMLLRPQIAMVTNIDEDHMHTYDHDLRRLEQSFLLFLQRLPADGLAVLCWEDAALRAVSRSLTAPVLTYGFSDLADVWATEIKYEGMCSHFMVHGLPGQPVPVPMTLALPGAHNVLNALGVLAVAAYLQLPMQACQQALQAFCGVGRRSQYHGQFCLQGKRYHLLEDYGHHPKEIEVTVEALKNAWPDERLVLVFQPHRYTRTQALWTAFCEAMATADALLLCEIYPAGEDPIPGFDVQMLISYLKAQHDLPVRYVPSLSMIEQELAHVIREGDVVLLQGAGTIHSAVKAMVASKTQVEATRGL